MEEKLEITFLSSRPAHSLARCHVTMIFQQSLVNKVVQQFWPPLNAQAEQVLSVFFRQSAAVMLKSCKQGHLKGYLL